MRIVLFIIGMLGVVWFTAPLFVAGSLNIGNATGIIIFLCIALYGILNNRINKLFGYLWNTNWGKIVYGIVGVIFLAVATLAISATVSMYRATQQRPALKSTVVVLGCRVYGEQPSIMLQARLDAASQYLVTVPDAVCILSGGQGNGENISEAECMYRYLTAQGIEPERLIKEDKSTSTRENLAFSKEIIIEQGLNPKIAIVTNEFHQYRAGEIAKGLELDSGAVCGETPWWLFPTYYVRELYGIVYEWIF